jgi:ABC-type amino acid transport substrate-binding protein
VRHRGRGLVGLAVLAAIALMLSACGLRIPADPDGTLAHIRDGTLQAGASVDGALVERDGDTLSGGAVTLVEEFAAELGADVEWTVGSEESLVHGLDTGALQLVVGGMTTDSPWAEQAGMTRGYPGIPGADGRDIVMLVPPGENALLVELEAFLDDEVG